MIVGVDMDGVVCDLHQPWLAAYNADYPEAPLRREDCYLYDLSKLVASKCGRRIYNYLNEDDLYATAPALPGALEGVRALRAAGCRVVFVTSTGRALAGQKRAWLEREDFLETGHGHDGPHDDLINMSDKGLLRADALVEDNPKQLRRFQGSLKILLDQPWNQPESQAEGLEGMLRVYNWTQVHVSLVRRDPKIDGSVLVEAEALVHGPRNADYGHPAENDARIAALWRAQFGWPVVNTDVWQAMVLTKLARERQRPRRDNRVDTAGYAEVGDWIHREGRAGETVSIGDEE